jgi:hypothetical protein
VPPCAHHQKEDEKLPKEVLRPPILKASRMVESRFEENEYLKFIRGRSVDRPLGYNKFDFFRK